MKRRMRMVALVAIGAVLLAGCPAPGSVQWVKTAGSKWEDWANEVAVDASGNVLVTGEFKESVDFGGGPLTARAMDVFVAKYSPSGVHQWSKSFGGSGSGIADRVDASYAIAADANGNVYLGATFGGTDANFGAGPVAAHGTYDGVLVKYSPTGQYLWSRVLGAANEDSVQSLAVDSSGNVVVTGWFRGTIDLGNGPVSSPPYPRQAVFVAKYSPSGAHLWSRVTADANGFGVAVDASGNVVVTGRAPGGVDAANFGGGPLPGYYQAFVAKFAAADGAHVWSKGLGGAAADQSEQGDGVAVDSDGNVLVTGTMSGGATEFGPAPIPVLGRDVFVVKLSSATGAPMWAKHVGGRGHDDAKEIAVDASDNVIIAGAMSGDANFGGTTLTPMSTDMYIAKYNASGTHLWSRNVLGQGLDAANGLAVQRTTGNIIVAGGFGYDLFRDDGGRSNSVGTSDVFFMSLTP